MNLNHKLEFAAKFAALLHADHGDRYGDAPYSVHLTEVVNTLIEFGESDKNMLCAGYLHDVVEDCFKGEHSTGFVVIAALFGDKVTSLVEAVTDEEGANRKERKAKTYPKIKAVPGATKVKLADRIVNLRQGLAAKNFGMFSMYLKERGEFQTSLRVLGELDEMWAAIDALYLEGEKAFKTRNRHQPAPEL